MKNSEYWKLRFSQLEEAQNKLANEGCKEIEGIYRQTLKEIEGKIDTWYRRLAKNNEISMAEARKFLSGSELKEFKWDVHDYIKYGKENAVSGQWMKQLENASAKFHISKYEALKIQTQQSFESLFAKQKGITSDTMAEVYKSGYYHTAFEIQKGFGIGWDISGIDQNQVEKVLAKPWAVDGKNFSERIWSNKEKLVSEVHNELTRNIITGADPQKAIDSIAKKMNTSKYNAGRLVMTEEAYFSSAVQKDCFDDLGVEEYEVVATLDSHTSDICRSMDGKHFPMKDYQAGVTAPPFHVFCRSTTCPWFDEDFGEVGERAARDGDGKTYYVPADMNYREWEETFVDGGDKSGFVSREEREEQERKDKGRKMVDDFWEETSGNVSGVEGKNDVDKSEKGGIINKKEVEMAGTDVHYVGKIDIEKFKLISNDIITDDVIITDERIQHIKERHPNDFEQYCQFMREIVSSPDYILEANKPKSALLLKSFYVDNKYFKAVLRFITSTDDSNFKNSIITFMKIDEKEWNRLIKNKKTLYKQE